MPDAPAGRRGWIAGGISILALVAFGVFVLPFAFVTPPPIITRFTSTHVFSPGSTTGRDVARVSIRLSQPSSVRITIKDGAGVIVHTIANGTVVRTTTLSVPWAGQTDAGTPVPDGTYTIDLDAHAGGEEVFKEPHDRCGHHAAGSPPSDGAATYGVVRGQGDRARGGHAPSGCRRGHGRTHRLA